MKLAILLYTIWGKSGLPWEGKWRKVRRIFELPSGSDHVTLTQSLKGNRSQFLIYFFSPSWCYSYTLVTCFSSFVGRLVLFVYSVIFSFSYNDCIRIKNFSISHKADLWNMAPALLRHQEREIVGKSVIAFRTLPSSLWKHPFSFST